MCLQVGSHQGPMSLQVGWCQCRGFPSGTHVHARRAHVPAGGLPSGNHVPAGGLVSMQVGSHQGPMCLQGGAHVLAGGLPCGGP